MACTGTSAPQGGLTPPHGGDTAGEVTLRSQQAGRVVVGSERLQQGTALLTILDTVIHCITTWLDPSRVFPSMTWPPNCERHRQTVFTFWARQMLRSDRHMPVDGGFLSAAADAFTIAIQLTCADSAAKPTLWQPE